MHVLDPKLRTQTVRFVAQSGLAGIFIVLMFLTFDTFAHTAVVASFGATSFIVFTMPRSPITRPRPLIGGYLVGTATGTVAYLLQKAILALAPAMSHHVVTMLVAGLAVAAAIFLMVALDAEHPPAAGIALALVVHACDVRTILAILGGVIVLSLARRFLKPYLINLR
jgi:CBS-domain-containing membrane protein